MIVNFWSRIHFFFATEDCRPSIRAKSLDRVGMASISRQVQTKNARVFDAETPNLGTIRHGWVGG